MGELALNPGRYIAPEGALTLGERSADGSKKVILYFKEKLFADIVVCETIDENEEPAELLARVEAPQDRGLDLLHHTSLFLPRDEATRIFGDQQEPEA